MSGTHPGISAACTVVLAQGYHVSTGSHVTINDFAYPDRSSVLAYNKAGRELNYLHLLVKPKSIAVT